MLSNVAPNRLKQKNDKTVYTARVYYSLNAPHHFARSLKESAEEAWQRRTH